MIPYNKPQYFKSDNIIQSFDFIARFLLSKNLINEKVILFCKRISLYDRIASSIFEKYNITINKNYHINICDNKIYLLIISLVNFVRYGLKQEYVIDFLNLYPIGFDNEKIWEFKEYCSVYDISDFRSDFVLLPIRKLKDKDTNLNIIKSINETRLKIEKLFLNLIADSQKNGICKAILNFFSEKEYSTYEYYNMFVEFLHKFQNIDLPIEIFEEELSKYIHNVSNWLSKKAMIDLIENMNFDNLSSKIIFIIIEDKDEIYDYEGNIPDFEDKYFIFLNNEYSEIEGHNVISINDISDCSQNHESNLKNFSYIDNSTRMSISEVSIAASKIENYYRCSLFYFFNCILDINNSKKFTFDSSEYGSLVHYTFEKYFKLYNGFDIETSVYKIVKEYIDSNFKFIYSSSRINYMIEKYSKNLIFIIDKMTKELEQDRFSPKYFEVKFCQTLKTDSGKSILLKGKIDRIDVDHERNEMRTVDYKTKNKKFNINNVIYGLNIQPIVYLKFFPEKSLKRVGAFYFCAKKPSINGDDADLNNVNLEKKINESMSLQGISLDNRHFMESRGSRNDSFSYKDFETIMEYSEFLVKKMAEDIISGNVYKNPKLLLGGTSQCENCVYKDICERKNMKYIKNIRYRTTTDVIEEMKNKMNFMES